MVIEKSKIYGVDNVGTQDPDDIVRTDEATGLAYELRNDGEIKSDFDRCYPWSDMREVMDDYGNVFVRIPKFYGRITKNADGTYKHQISGYRYDGFTTLFIDGEGNELDYVDVGKYEGSMADDAYAPNAHCMRSVSGATVKVNITIGDFRKACMNNGKGYQQYDYLIHSIIRELFLIEFATTNTQSIMYGYANGNSAAILTGHTDDIATPSGSGNKNHTVGCTTCHTDGVHACKYRGIENLWGNVEKWCDGYSLKMVESDEGATCADIYLCFDPQRYESEHYTAPYFKAARSPYLCADCCKVMETFDSMPLLTYPTNADANCDEYYCDYADTDWGTVLRVGGSWYSGDGAGLWYAYGDYDASYCWSGFGGRLCRKPL